MDLGVTAEQCRSAYAAGDIAFFNASGCVQSNLNNELIASAKKTQNIKLIVLLGVALIATGTIVYYAKNKKR